MGASNTFLMMGVSFRFFYYHTVMDGKTLLVLSDIHGNVTALETVLKWAKNLHDGGIEAAVFLGDGIRDLSRAAGAAGFTGEWKMVRGNNDDAFSVPETAVLDFGGHRFFLCHGHRYSLFGGHHSLVAAARSMEADGVLFGHSHVPYCGNNGGVTLVNPGSIGRPRGRAGATFALVECAPEMQIEARFFGINRGGDIGELRVNQN